MIPDSLNNISNLTNHQIDFVIQREIRHLEKKMRDAAKKERVALAAKHAGLAEFQGAIDWYRIETTIHEVNQLQAYRNQIYKDYCLAASSGKPVNQMDAKAHKAIVVATDRRIAIMIRAATNFAADKGWVLELEHNGDELLPVCHQVSKEYFQYEINVERLPHGA